MLQVQLQFSSEEVVADEDEAGAPVTADDARVSVHVRVELPGLGVVGLDVKLELRALGDEVVHLAHQAPHPLLQGGGGRVRLVTWFTSGTTSSRSSRDAASSGMGGPGMCQCGGARHVSVWGGQACVSVGGHVSVSGEGGQGMWMACWWWTGGDKVQCMRCHPVGLPWSMGVSACLPVWGSVLASAATSLWPGQAPSPGGEPDCKGEVSGQVSHGVRVLY